MKLIKSWPSSFYIHRKNIFISFLWFAYSLFQNIYVFLFTRISRWTRRKERILSIILWYFYEITFDYYCHSTTYFWSLRQSMYEKWKRKSKFLSELFFLWLTFNCLQKPVCFISFIEENEKQLFLKKNSGFNTVRLLQCI